MSSPISAERFAVVDVETSGLSVQRHHVLQVGVVVVNGNGDVLDRYSSLVAPRSKWFFRVGPTKIHGIRRRDARRAPDGALVLTELARRLEGARFVAHNAPFDLSFLRKASAEHGVPLPVHEPICTLRASRALDPGRTMSHRLTDLCARYGVSLTRPHDALADADATAAVLPHLLQAYGITTADQLASLPPAS